MTEETTAQDVKPAPDERPAPEQARVNPMSHLEQSTLHALEDSAWRAARNFAESAHAIPAEHRPAELTHAANYILKAMAAAGR